MSLEESLQRVEADCAAGDFRMARQRLRGLIVAYPARLEVRERAAQVYRLQGELSQAGRWTYLSDERDPAEVAQFEKSTRDLVERMRALAWCPELEQAISPAARERLALLLEQAREQTGDKKLGYAAVAAGEWYRPLRVGEEIARAGCGALGVAVIVLFFVGVIDGFVTVLSWLR